MLIRLQSKHTRRGPIPNPNMLFLYLAPPWLLVGGTSLVFGLTRKSRYEKLQIQNDELKAYMNVLTGQIDTLRIQVAELRKEMELSKRRIWQLRKETNSLRVQKERLEDSVEILTKEREIFQNTIQNLWQATRKVRAREPLKILLRPKH